MFQHVIWDVDGTLFDTYPAIARSLQAAAHDLGAAASYEEIMRLALVSVDHCVTTLCGIYALEADQLGERFDQRYQSVTPADQLPFPGVIDVCTAVQARGGLNLIVTHGGAQGSIGYWRPTG